MYFKFIYIYTGTSMLHSSDSVFLWSRKQILNWLNTKFFFKWKMFFFVEFAYILKNYQPAQHIHYIRQCFTFQYHIIHLINQNQCKWNASFLLYKSIGSTYMYKTNKCTRFLLSTSGFKNQSSYARWLSKLFF